MFILQRSKNWNLEVLPVFSRNQAPDKREKEETTLKIRRMMMESSICKSWKMTEGTIKSIPIPTIPEYPELSRASLRPE